MDERAPQVGEMAPDFELPSDSGERVRLSQFRGQKVILYFYPKGQGTHG
jgi:thioredoxin-dependent peroxiredoxin